MPGIRHISLAVALGAVLASHWIDVLRRPGDGPGSFVAALALAVFLTAAWAIQRNRRQPSL